MKKLDYKKLWNDLKIDIGSGSERLSRNNIKIKMDILEEEQKDNIQNGHYLIIGYYTQSPIGCCSTEAILDVLEEEPLSTFQRVTEEECPNCQQYKEN